MTGRNTRKSPYVGPRPFGRDDPLPARRREVRQLCDLLIAERIVLLHSPSGAGKTSLIEADNGLRAALHEEDLLVRPSVRVSQAVPAGIEASNRYVLSVLRSLEEDRAEAERIAVERLAAMELAEYLDLRRVMVDAEGEEAHEAREVLIFDQFEEVLTADPTDVAGRERFFGQLGRALEARHRWALFVIREDHLGALEPWFRRLPTHMAHRYRLDLLGEGGAKEAIVRPAKAQGVSFEPAAVERLVDDLRRVLVQDAEGKLEPQLGPWVEPVQLQVVCLWMWEQLESDDMFVDVHEVGELGNVDAALGAYYAERIEAVERRTGIEQRRLRAWVGRELLSPQGYRTQVMRGSGVTEGLENAALDALEDAHLVRAEQRHGQRWYELAHDRLVVPVLEDNDRWERENLHPMQARAALWARNGKPDSELLSEAGLSEAEAWVEARGEGLEEPDLSFVAASRKLRLEKRALRDAQANALEKAQELAEVRAREATKQRRYKWLFGVVGGIAVIAAIGSYWQYREANQAKRNAEATDFFNMLLRIQAQKDAARAQEQSTRVRDQVRMLAVKEADGDPTIQAVLLREVEHPDSTRGWLQAVLEGAPMPKALALLRGHDGWVSTAVFSLDGRRVVTASEDGTARVWSSDGKGEPTVLEGHDGAILSASFSPDGTRVVTVSTDAAARVWSSDGSGEPVVLRGHSDMVVSASFSPDGRRIVTGSLDRTARIWRSDGLGEPVVLLGHRDSVVSASFSPDGRRVVTASADGTARVWPSNGGGVPLVVEHEGPLESVAFSPDGSRIVTASRDSTARVWSSYGEGELLLEIEHYGVVVSAAFSSDGERVVTASEDGTVRVRSVEGGGETVELGPVGRGVLALSASFSPDGSRVVTGYSDGRTLVWSSDGSGEPIVLSGHGPSFSPDGRRVVTASVDGTARVWPSDRAEGITVLRAPAGFIRSASFSPDGSRVLAGAIATVQVWSSDGRGESDVLRGPNGSTMSAAFTPDGSRVVTANEAEGVARVWSSGELEKSIVLHGPRASGRTISVSPDASRVLSLSSDGTIRIWSLDREGEEPVEFEVGDDSVDAASFSMDGSQVVTMSEKGNVRVWSSDGSPSVKVVEKAEGLVSAAFSFDGRRLVTGSTDGTARVWSLDGSGGSVVLRGHHDAVVSVAFSRDGRRVVTGSEDGTARVWSSDGSGRPLVLSWPKGDVLQVLSVAFDPDGRRVLAATSRVVWVWSLDSSEWSSILWRATSYCLPIEERMTLLSETTEEATERHATCTATVAKLAAEGAYGLDTP